MEITEAVQFFKHIPKIHRKLKTIENVGLGYLTLGQQSTNLSGGNFFKTQRYTELPIVFVLDITVATNSASPEDNAVID